MEKRDGNNFQPEKSPEEIIRYMLKIGISSDVCIEVGPPDGETVKFRAHKCILMSRSEVFEGMFSSGMTECSNGSEANEAKVRVEDIDADTFKQLLNYMYCETTSICPESAECLLYAAKKYMLPKLVEDCCNCLLKSLDLSNVLHFLDHSLYLDEPKLQEACLKLISANAVDVLTGTEILSTSRLSIGAILDATAMPVKESVMYETAVNWATHQFQSSAPGVSPSDQQIREILGGLLYKIRFPVMKIVEFAELSEGNDVLTAQEKVSIYFFLVTEKTGCELKFPRDRRCFNEVWIDRPDLVTVNSEWPSTPGVTVDAIKFASDQDVLLTGIGLFTAFSSEGCYVDVEILQSNNSLFRKRVSLPHSTDSTPFKVLLDEPIFITSEVIYSVKTLAHGSIGHYGNSCVNVCTEESVTLTFSDHSESQNTTSTRGQIPRLYFSAFVSN